MNIYISRENEEQLRTYDGSMSGLINKLLTDYFVDKAFKTRGPVVLKGPDFEPYEPEDDEIDEPTDIRETWIIDEAGGGVFDTETGERMDAGLDDVKWLKANGKTR